MSAMNTRPWMSGPGEFFFLDQERPLPGVPGGKFIGAEDRGWESMSVMISRRSQHMIAGCEDINAQIQHVFTGVNRDPAPPAMSRCSR